MTDSIQLPQTTVTEWRSLIAKKSGCGEHAVDDVLDRYGIEVSSVAPRRKTILLRSVRLAGRKSGLKDPHQEDIPDQNFDYSWKGLGRGLWIVTSDKNSKGKSSIINAFKAAIKGKFPGTMKPDVWSWLSLLQVEFSIDGSLHRVTMGKNDTKAEGAVPFAAKLERQQEDQWLVIAGKSKPEEFEDVMSDFFMQELGFEKFRAFQRRTESFSHHGWPSMGSALFLTGASDALFGDETTDALAMRLLQLFIGLPWISTYTELQASQKKVEAEDSRIDEAAKVPRARLLARIGQLEAERAASLSESASLPDRDAALLEKIAADTALTQALEAKVKTDRELIALNAQREEAQSAFDETRNELQQMKDETSAGYVFRKLRPTSCPSCDAVVKVGKSQAEGHSCTLCGQEPGVQDEDLGQRLEELKEQVSQAGLAKASLEHAVALKTEEINGLTAKLQAAERRRDGALAILNAEDRSAVVANRLIGINARIQELNDYLPDEPTKTSSTDVRILKDAVQVTKDCFEGMQTSILKYFSERLFKIAVAIGVENLQSVDVKLSKISIRQGNTDTTFTKLNEGEKLRFRTAAALAAIETAKWSGVGRHPGFVVLDSPAAQEMSEDDFASLLANLTQVLETNRDMQIIVGAVMRPKILDVVSCSGMEYAKGEDHLF
jgi:cell division septum initiation protein DivIVA